MKKISPIEFSAKWGEKGYFTISVGRHPGRSSQKARSIIGEPQWERVSRFCAGHTETSGGYSNSREAGEDGQAAVCVLELLAGGPTPPFTLCWVGAGCSQAVSSQTIFLCLVLKTLKMGPSYNKHIAQGTHLCELCQHTDPPRLC